MAHFMPQAAVVFVPVAQAIELTMHNSNLNGRWLRPGVVLWLAVLLLGAASAAAEEQSFDLLKIGTRTYRNVTVTTKSKDYILFLHAGGMTSMKVTELPPDVREQLGYVETPKPQGTAVGVWAKGAVAKLDLPSANNLMSKPTEVVAAAQTRLGRRFVPLVAAIGVALYLFFCLCYAAICQKTGNPGGVLVWVPIFQFIPLLRAANMSGWWFLCLFIPILNLLCRIIWSVKIVQARGKSELLAIPLILPGTNLLVLLYLALSNGGPAREDKRIEIMTLDTA